MPDNEDNEGNNHPLIVTANYPPEQIYRDNSRHTRVVVTQTRSVVITERRTPPDYLWLSCIAMCFCWPLACFALITSRASARHAEKGDYSKALESGKSARNIAVASIVIGLILTVILVVIRVPYR